MNFFDILHDDRAQQRATFGPGVRFQKIIQGLTGYLSVKKLGFRTFSRKRYYRRSQGKRANLKIYTSWEIEKYIIEASCKSNAYIW